MSKLKTKRLKVVKQMMSNHGIQVDGEQTVMSLWDLAFNINNSWNSQYFVNMRKYPSKYDSGYALGSWQLWLIFRGIRHAVKGEKKIRRFTSIWNKSEYISCRI